MKYSGAEWIGKIPDRWEVRKVKQCFYVSKEQANQKDPVILSLARSGVKVRDISNNEGQLAASYDNYNVVQPGDLLLNPMDLYSGANCNMSEISGVISPAYTNLRKKVELNPKYFDYYFKTQYWAMAMFAHGKGVSFDNRWTMNAESVLNYYIPYPSFDEQNKIVEFINSKTAEIDSLIEVENKQIEKLKEYKQAVITEAVTKGLDKNVPLKDSGVEWIGEIPEEWSVNRLKFIASCNDESLKEDTSPEAEIHYVDIGSVSLENGITNVESFTFENAPSRARRITMPGDIIVSTVRTYLKAIAIINDNNLIVSTGFCVIRPTSNMNKKYVEFWCKSNKFTDEVSRNSCGISYPAINASTLIGFWITTPPLIEQEKIANHLVLKCKEIDALISIKQRKIEELSDYKKSLIYEYVTGKKEAMA